MPGTKTNICKVNSKISELFPNTDGQATKLIIADFGFRELPESCKWLDESSRTIAGEVKKIMSLTSRKVIDYNKRNNSGETISDEDREAYVDSLKINATLECANGHGFACQSVAQAPKELCEEHRHHLNLSPHISLKLLHLDPISHGLTGANTWVQNPSGSRDAPMGLAETEDSTADWSIAAVIDGLDRLIVAAEKNDIRKGDVVVFPLELRIHGEGVVPITVDFEIDRRIQTLTNTHSISVVASAGNDFLEEEWLEGRNASHQDWCSSWIVNAGVTCGAIVVAQDSLKEGLETRAGYRWIDAFLDYVLPAWAGKPAVTDLPEHAQEFHDQQEKIRRAFSGAKNKPNTSAASVAVASMLATVQEVRRRRAGLDPLKPYEARAHLRQWRCQSPCDTPHGHSHPDILGWLIGTQVLRIGPNHPISGDQYEVLQSDLDALLFGACCQQ